jgi:hypothetical protein
MTTQRPLSTVGVVSGETMGGFGYNNRLSHINNTT